MPDEKPTKPPAQPSPGTTSHVVVGRLLDAQEKDRERDEREHAAAIGAFERQVTLWQRTALALIAVIAILVSGVVGVGVTGKLPGVGEIQIVQPGSDAPDPEPPDPEPSTPALDPAEVPG